jgi:hypothetical protein
MKRRLQQWGAVLVVMGGASLILPSLGMQLRIFNLFGGGSPALSIAMIVVGAVLWLIGAASDLPAPGGGPKTQPGTGSVPPPIPPRSISNCPKCGGKVSPGDRFCMECGNPLVQAARTPPPVSAVSAAPKQVRSHFGRVLLIGAVVVIGAIAVWLAMFPFFKLPSSIADWQSIFSKIAATPKSTPTALRSPPTPQPTPSLAPTLAPLPSPTLSAPSTGTLIRRVWLEHNYVWGGNTYMVIHCDFQVSAADTTSRRVHVEADFYLSNGSKMPGGLPKLTKYTTPDGQAATIEIAEVQYNVTTWADFPLYMPVAGLTRGQNCFGVVQITDPETKRVLETARTPTFNRN